MERDEAKVNVYAMIGVIVVIFVVAVVLMSSDGTSSTRVRVPVGGIIVVFIAGIVGIYYLLTSDSKGSNESYPHNVARPYLRPIDASTDATPSNLSRTLTDQASSQIDRREYREALPNLNQAIRLDSKNAQAFYLRGLARRETSRVSDSNDAINDLSEAIRLGLRNTEIFSLRARLWPLHQYQNAINDFSEVLKIKPSSEIFLERGRNYLFTGFGDMAIADFTEALQLNPKLATAYEYRAMAWLAKKNYLRALNDAESAILLNGISKSVLGFRGQARLGVKDFDGALADFDEVIRRDPGDYFCLSDRGDAWAEKGDNDRAIADYTESIRLEPMAATFFKRGLRYEIVDELGLALADFRHFSRVKPKNENGLEAIKRIESKMAKRIEATLFGSNKDD